jgi:hypothetical protein
MDSVIMPTTSVDEELKADGVMEVEIYLSRSTPVPLLMKRSPVLGMAVDNSWQPTK